MVQKFLPKIKIGTAKNVAKSLLATTKGKSISDTKFKKFLKQDKGLKKFVYASSDSSLVKYKAKQFFSNVLGSTKDKPGLKINRLAAKKLGFKISKDGDISSIGLKKLYNQASTEQLAGQQQKQAEPTPEEVRRQKRHDEAAKTFHKRDRADEIHKERQKQVEPVKQGGQSAAAPLTHAAVGSVAGLHRQTGSPSDQAAPAGRPATSTPALLPLLVLPLGYLHGTAENLAWLTKKLDKLITQTLAGLRIFRIVSRETTGQETPPDLTNETAITLAAKQAQAQLCVFGYLKKTASLIEIGVDMINAENGQRLTLVRVKEDTDDIFHVERQISWQLVNTLQADSHEETAAPETPKKAEDLPI